MKNASDKTIVKDDNISDFISEEQRTYFSNKLFEAENHNLTNPKVYTFDEFQKKIKDKYEI